MDPRERSQRRKSARESKTRFAQTIAETWPGATAGFAPAIVCATLAQLHPAATSPSTTTANISDRACKRRTAKGRTILARPSVFANVPPRLHRVVSLSAVIPATDRRATLERVVAAIEGARAAPEEVIVVDRPGGLGPAGARNLGARKAVGEVIVFIDADVEVHEDVFERLRDAFEEDPGIAAVFGSYDDDPGGKGAVSDFRNLLHHYVHQQGAGLTTTFWAGLGAIRRDALLELGGFDEARFRRPSVEDIELGARLYRTGSRIVLDPSIQGKHLKRWTLLGMIKTDLLDRGVPWVRMMLADGSHSTVLNLGWRHRVGAGAAVVFVVALVRKDVKLASGALALQLVLDVDFYRLLYRRRGAGLVASGVALHLVHRLTSAAAVPIAVAAHLADSRRGR